MGVISLQCTLDRVGFPLNTIIYVSNLVLCIFHTHKVIRLWVLDYVTEEVALRINFVVVLQFHHNPITWMPMLLYINTHISKMFTSEIKRNKERSEFHRLHSYIFLCSRTTIMSSIPHIRFVRYLWMN